MDLYIEKLVNLYTKNSNVEYAEWSKKYMRNQFEFLGIRAPIRQSLNKQFINEYGLPSIDKMEDTILMLWDMTEREYQYAAMEIMKKVKKNLSPNDMSWLEGLLTKKSWWDTIDVISPHIVGHLFSAYPELISHYSEQWIEDDNFWLQRSAILYQLYYKEKTNEDILYRYILRRADSEEFFVQKAIGWSLRQYAKTRPDSVKSFVLQHPLKPLSKREALKHIQ